MNDADEIEEDWNAPLEYNGLHELPSLADLDRWDACLEATGQPHPECLERCGIELDLSQYKGKLTKDQKEEIMKLDGELAKLEKKLDDISFIEKVMKVSRVISPVDVNQFDMRPDFLYLRNGFFLFDEDRFVPFSDPNNPMSRLVDMSEYEALKARMMSVNYLRPYKYDPNAECENFDVFLYTIFEGNQEMIDYIWRVIGYSLTGYTDKEIAFFLYGPSGANGKSVLMSVLCDLLGNFARFFNPETLFARVPGASSDYDRANLMRTRVAIMSELPSNAVLNDAAFKQLVSSDPITARPIYRRPITFTPTHKVFIMSNHAPRLRGASSSIARRLHMIPFNYEIPVEKRIPKRVLQTIFRGEMPGIFARAIRGWRESRGMDSMLEMPRIMRDALAEYFDSEDVYSQYADEFLEPCEYDMTLTEFCRGLEVFCKTNDIRMASFLPRLIKRKLAERNGKGERQIEVYMDLHRKINMIRGFNFNDVGRRAIGGSEIKMRNDHEF